MKNYGFVDKNLNESPMNLLSTDVSGNICGEFVEFTIHQVYENIGENSIEGVYTFPIPDTGVITGFKANLGGITLSAIIEEKHEANKILKNFNERELNKLSIEEEDNVYKITIGNILTNEKIQIDISYMDQLLFEDNEYNLTIPFIENPRAMNFDDINEEAHLTNCETTLNLLIETFNAVNIYSPSHNIQVDYDTPTLCKVSLVKNETLDRDLEVCIKEDKNKGFYGMYYSFPKHECDETLIYLKLYPKLDKNFKPENKNYVFLLDTSKSMRGEKLEEAKSTLELCLRNLRQGDTFNIVAFHNKLNMFSREGNVEFNNDNLKKASQWIKSLTFGRGSDIYEALKWTIEKSSNENPYTILLFTDDLVEEENEIIDYVKENIGENRIFTFGIDTSVNSYFINKLATVGYGKAEFIYPGEVFEDMVLRQFNRINRPQVDVREIKWGNDMDVIRTYPRTIEYIYDRELFSVFCKVKGDINGPVTIKGYVGEKSFEQSIFLENFELNDNAYLIQKVWSRKRIESIQERMLGERGNIKEAMRNKVIELSKEFEILSNETTFIMLQQIEDPILGVAMTKLIPIEVTDEIMFNLSYAYFLDSPSFLYKVKNNKHIKNKSKINNLYKYSREQLMRLIAKHQGADGAFGDSMEITLKSTIALLIGREDTDLYINQINKAIDYMVNYINIEKSLNEKETLLYLLCLQLIDIKDVANDENEMYLEKSLDYIKDIIENNEYISNAYLHEEQDLSDIKKSISFMLALHDYQSKTIEEIEKSLDNEDLNEICNIAILEAR